MSISGSQNLGDFLEFCLQNELGRNGDFFNAAHLQYRENELILTGGCK